MYPARGIIMYEFAMFIVDRRKNRLFHIDGMDSGSAVQYTVDEFRRSVPASFVGTCEPSPHSEFIGQIHLMLFSLWVNSES